jgi:hypothetical protein
MDYHPPELEPCVDFTFAPCLPSESEYRQAYAEAQRVWLYNWEPQQERRPQ